MINKIFLSFIFLLNSLLLSQIWQPFHMEDLNNHRNHIMNYQEVDDRASLMIPDNQRQNLSHNVIGYLPYWEYSLYPNFNLDLLTHINYFSAELNSSGEIINDHNWNDLYIVEYAHDRGVKVSLCATLFGQSELTSLLSNPQYRENAINNLLQKVVSKNADGIDIDFELLPTSQRDNLVTFMEELSYAFHQEIDDPIITMATPAIDWSNAWDYDALATICDGLFIMGYNYFYSGSSNAGPVSPLGGYFYDIQYTLEDYLIKTNNQSNKLILGLPYYGYDWPVQSSLMNDETTGSGISRTYANAQDMSNQYGYIYDLTSNSPWFSYNTQNWQQCWYEDSLSISTKYQLAKDSNLQGVGIWALGYDNGYSQMWGSLSDHFYSELTGDVNLDDIVNVLDVIIHVNIVLQNTNDLIGDLNNDTTVNIQDIVLLVNLILNNRHS